MLWKLSLVVLLIFLILYLFILCLYLEITRIVFRLIIIIKTGLDFPNRNGLKPRFIIVILSDIGMIILINISVVIVINIGMIGIDNKLFKFIDLIRPIPIKLNLLLTLQLSFPSLPNLLQYPFLNIGSMILHVIDFKL